MKRRILMIWVAVLCFTASALPAQSAEPRPVPCKERHGHAYCLIIKYWKNEAAQDEALEVVDCESDFDEDAISPTNDWGVFQLNRPSHEGRAARLGYDWEDMLDAGKNTRVAENLYTEAGWDPWGPSSSCHGN